MSASVWHIPLNFVHQAVVQPRYTGIPYISVDDGGPFGSEFPLIVTAFRYNPALNSWRPLGAIFEVVDRVGNRLEISGTIEGTADLPLLVGDILSMDVTALAVREIHRAVDSINLNAGSGDLSFSFQQLLPASSWIIVHGLNKYPSVSVVDSAGDWVIGDVVYLDSNSLRIDFSGAFSGSAYLN